MANKQVIIQAASRLFAEKGYEGMTMKEIAQEVGIKAPSLYAFFQSKEQIMLQIYKDVISGHLQLAVSHTETTDITVQVQLKQMLNKIMDYQLKESVSMKIYMRMLLFPPEVLRVDLKAEVLRLEQEEHELFRAMFQRAIDNGEISDGDSGKLATALICVMDGLFWAMQRLDEEHFRKRFQLVWEQFWQGII